MCQAYILYDIHLKVMKMSKLTRVHLKVHVFEREKGVDTTGCFVNEVQGAAADAMGQKFRKVPSWN